MGHMLIGMRVGYVGEGRVKLTLLMFTLYPILFPAPTGLAELEDEVLKARRRRVILESQNAADTLKLQRLEAGREAEEDLDATALSQSPASPLGLRADSISALGLSPVQSGNFDII